MEYLALVALLAVLLGAGLAAGDPPQRLARLARRVAGAPPSPPPRALLERAQDEPLAEFLAERAAPGRDPRMDWSTDGCSAPVVGDAGRSFDFGAACLRHDFGYRNARALGLFDEERRRRIDERFLHDMEAHCATRPPAQRRRCGRWARLFFSAVRRFGARRRWWAPARAL